MIWWQDCYPERLGKLLIVHSPYIFMTAWKVIYPFIDNNTKKKVYLQSFLVSCLPFIEVSAYQSLWFTLFLDSADSIY